MKKIGNLLWKMFSMTLVFFWGFGDGVRADDSQYDSSVYSDYIPGGNGYGQGEKVQICPRGQYVYSCSGNRVGYNWLSKITFSKSDGTKIFTDNYLIGDNYDQKIDQMRTFFAGSGQINKQYCTSANSCNETIDTTFIQTEGNEKTLNDRDFILGYLCNPLTEGVSIGCATCPDNAYVRESFVRRDNYTPLGIEGNLLVRHSWEFHTIADCYMTQFEDSTGDFIYVKSQTRTNTDNQGTPCYYSSSSQDSQYMFAGAKIENVSLSATTRYYNISTGS